MIWLYSNAVGGVKALVPDERSEEAESLLTTHAGMDGPPPSVSGADADRRNGDICERCGGAEFESKLPGKRVAILTWLFLGVPLGWPLRRWYCRRCGSNS
jgi:hypothetical protein